MERKTGNETFSNGKRLVDYWSWAHSDILGNAERGKLAEYIVAMALGLDIEIRREWDAYDLKTEAGTRIEVKSSAYLQSWQQNHLSEIRFDISPKRIWNEGTNKYSDEVKRNSDVYVFCLFNCKNTNNADLLNLDRWEFYIVETEELNKKTKNQKSISLNSLKKLEHLVVNYERLKDVIK